MLSSRSALLVLVLGLFAPSIRGQAAVSNAEAPILGFVDISATGTAMLNAGDDTSHGFVSTIGNDLFPAGNVAMCVNGFAVAGAGVAGEAITFQIQVFQDAACSADTIQIIYPDTVFSGLLDGAGAATIGPIPGLPSGFTVYAVALSAPQGAVIPTGISLPTTYSVP